MEPTLEKIKAASDRNRLRVLAALMHKEELCACQVVELLQVSGATASRHMSILHRAGLVGSRKEGRWVYYRLNRDADPAFFQWLEMQVKNADELGADRALLAEIVACEPEELCRKQRGEECCPK